MINRAISRAISIAVVCSVILATLLGYGLSYLIRPSSSTLTVTQSGATSTVEVISVETFSNCGLACPTTSSSTASAIQSASSINGLRLDLSVAPSNGSVGTWVISEGEFNTLNSVNNVYIANNWSYPESYELNPNNPCGLLGPLGLGIFQGYYGMNNYTGARALPLYNTSLVYMCVTTVSVPNAYYSIRPDSNIARVLYPGSTFSNTNTTLSLSFSTEGYWTGGDGSQAPATFHKFAPGIYTVLGADEWGKVVLVHINVDSNGLIIGTSTSTTSMPTATSGRVYEVTFQQVRYCSKYNILPWAVTLNGMTVVQPSNQTLPLPTNTFSTIVPNQNLTRITFSVPSGTYNYTVSGGSIGPGGQLYPSVGTVIVNGSDVLVNLDVYLSLTC